MNPLKVKPSALQTHLIFWGTLLALFLLLVGPAINWSFHWPPGLGTNWKLYVALTIIAFAIDIWGVLRCKGFSRIWMALLFVPTFLSAKNLLHMYNLERSHRITAEQRKVSPSSFLDLLQPGGSTGGRRSFNLPIPYAKAESEISTFMMRLGAIESPPPPNVGNAMRHWTWGESSLSLYSGREFSFINISGAMVFPATDSDPSYSTVMIYLANRWPPRTQPQ